MDPRDTEVYVLREFHRELADAFASKDGAQLVVDKYRKELAQRFGHEQPDADALLMPVAQIVQLEDQARRLARLR